MDCQPVFGYGRVPARWSYVGDGYGEAVATGATDLELHLTTNLRLGFEERRAYARTRLVEGDNVFVALSWSEHEPPRTWDDASDRMWHTAEYWRQWINQGEFPDHPWQEHLQHSALTLNPGPGPRGQRLLLLYRRRRRRRRAGPRVTTCRPS
jgi:GH15 family glucan-1,4-alpha-glucosidase